jgi:hypothetical protein
MARGAAALRAQEEPRCRGGPFFVAADRQAICDLADEPESVARLYWPRQLARVQFCRRRQCRIPLLAVGSIGNLADQRLLTGPDSQSPAARTMPDRIARQFMYGDYHIVGQLDGEAKFGRVGGDRGPDLVQVVDVESLI